LKVQVLRSRSTRMKGRDHDGSALSHLRQQRRPGLREGGPSGGGSGEVVPRVAGTSFYPVVAAIRAGLLQQVFPVAFPHIPNFDVVGVIAEVSEGVSGWSAGDAVVAFLPMTEPGAVAEYVAAPSLPCDHTTYDTSTMIN